MYALLIKPGIYTCMSTHYLQVGRDFQENKTWCNAPVNNIIELRVLVRLGRDSIAWCAFVQLTCKSITVSETMAYMPPMHVEALGLCCLFIKGIY